MLQYVESLAYNTSIKISGQQIVLKRFDKLQSTGYKKRKIEGNGTSHIKTDKEREIEKKERFQKSNRRAKDIIFDTVACNCGKEDRIDYLGKRQKIKFMTLTFKDEITDIKEANKKFTDFLKRLSYNLFGIRKNVIKYLAVPELQDRGVWHFHVILFNCPYVLQKDLEKVWGHGYVFINALKRKDGKRDIDGVYVAQYITKYLTKEINLDIEKREMRLAKKDKIKNIYDYDKHKDLGLDNMKRYSCSRGLKRAVKTYFNLSKKEVKELLELIKTQKYKSKKEFKEIYAKKYTHNGQTFECNMMVNSFSIVQRAKEGLTQYLINLSRTSYLEKEFNTSFNYKFEGVMTYKKYMGIYAKEVVNGFCEYHNLQCS